MNPVSISHRTARYFILGKGLARFASLVEAEKVDIETITPRKLQNHIEKIITAQGGGHPPKADLTGYQPVLRYAIAE